MALGALLGHGHLPTAHQRQSSGSLCSCSGREAGALHSSRITDNPSAPLFTQRMLKPELGSTAAYSSRRQQRLEAARHAPHHGAHLWPCGAHPACLASAAVAHTALQQPGAHLDQAGATVPIALTVLYSCSCGTVYRRWRGRNMTSDALEVHAHAFNVFGLLNIGRPPPRSCMSHAWRAAAPVTLLL